MKKLLAIMLCVIMMISAAAIAETYNVTATLADGTGFTASCGTDDAGDFIIVLNDIPSAGTVGIQIGSEVAYISAMGMTLSVEYASVMDTLAPILSSSMAENGIDMSAVSSLDVEAFTELFTTIGTDLISLVGMESTDEGTVISLNFTLAQLWDAIGADLTAWMSAHTDMVDQLLQMSNASNVTAAQLVEALNGMDFSQIDFAQELQIAMINGSSFIPEIIVSGAWSVNGTTAAELALSFNEQQLAIRVVSNGQTVADIVLTYAFTGDGLTATLSSMGQLLLTVDVAATADSMQPITDGSDAMPLASLLGMLMNQAA